MPTRVLLVEDVDELRATMRQALRLHGDFDVVADVADGLSAIEAAVTYTPDVVVLDLGLPDLAGAELVTRVRNVAPRARIVVYTRTIVGEGSSIATTADAVVQKDQSVRYLVGLLANFDRDAPFTATITLGPSTGDVRVARRFLQDHCHRWGCAKYLPDVNLVLSELVTNALTHAGTSCELRARFSHGRLRLEVRDQGFGTPDLRAAPAESEGGRGLMIVSSLAEAWGVETEADGGKTVWAELEVVNAPRV